MYQVEMSSLDDLVPKNHSYRRFIQLWSFNYAQRFLKKLENENSYKGYRLLRLFKCLLLQFMEDLSDRELMRFLQENTSANTFYICTACEPFEIFHTKVKYTATKSQAFI